MIKFKDLKFKEDEYGFGMKRARVNLPNEYTVSIIIGKGTYGGDEGLYECWYFNPDHEQDDNEDPEGYLDEDGVEKYIQVIAEKQSNTETKEEI